MEGSRRATLTYLPASYVGDAIGEISEKIVNEPSNGRSGLGLPMVPDTLARTLNVRYRLSRTPVFVGSGVDIHEMIMMRLGGEGIHDAARAFQE